MSTATDIQKDLRQVGRAMVLRRRIGQSGDFVECTVKGASSHYKPDELVGLVLQGDRRIRISPLDMGDWPGAVPVGVQPAQWPAKIVKGDILDGATVQGAEPKYDGETLICWVVWVRG